LTFFPKSLNVFSLILWAHTHIHKVFTEYHITQPHKHTLITMNVLMFYQIILFADCLMTQVIWTLTTKYMFMFYQTALFTGCLTKHVTGKRTLTTMYAFMYYHILLTDCLSTHFTGKMALTTM
jgi:hypothetical protein